MFDAFSMTSCPENSVYIVYGELSFVVTAIKRGNRWSSHMYQNENQGILLRNFSNLKEILNHVTDLSELEPYTFLSPFLEVIRSEDTTAPVTEIALSSVNKFLAYNLINVDCESAPIAVENIADAAIHAKFVGTDTGSDEVVLIKILHVLRTLLLTPVGSLLTNESVIEIMQSCFRICFEMRLSELLRKSAEHSLMDMVQLLFSRLPQFSEDVTKPGYFSFMNKRLKMRTGSGLDSSRSNRRKKSKDKRAQKIESEPYSARPNEYNMSKINNNVQPSLPTPPDSTTGSPIDNLPVSPSEIKRNVISNKNDCMPPEISVISADQDKDDVEASLERKGSGDSGTNDIENLSEELNVINEDQVSEQTDAMSDVGSAEVVDDIHSFPSMTDVSVISSISAKDSDFVNTQGVRFTPANDSKNGPNTLMPYGLPCVKELFSFLISLTKPMEKNNSDVMVHIGLTLMTVALESGADHIVKFKSLMCLVRDNMCRNLLHLLNSERLSLFGAALRATFLLFESMRSHLKLQLEMYLMKLMSIIVSESQKVSYEQREIALDSVVQLWRIPGFVTELYLNYDCDLYCSNLFEDITKLLSKNTFPVSGLYSTHLLSLDALLTVVDYLEDHCNSRIRTSQNNSELVGLTSEESEKNGSVKSESTFGNLNVTALQASGYQMADYMKRGVPTSMNKKNVKLSENGMRYNRIKISDNIPSHEALIAIKHRKKLLAMGTDHFNTKPSKGIAFLQENELLSNPLNSQEVTKFLKENPKLDKKMIGEYISSKKNQKVLEVFVRSFSFENTRVDEALRMYLEVFRLPGEAPLISFLLEQFADHWHKSNNEPFANCDAAFTLAYAIIMLNVDQHNHNVKKQSTPMTLEEFKKNLSQVNGGQDFVEEMLDEIYNAIKHEEIVMPAEQTGIVRENYLWKVLLKRGTTKDGLFIHAPNGLFDQDLFSLIWGPTVAALSFVFDKSNYDTAIIQRSISGFRKCAMISAHYGMSDVFDNLIISLLKFTTLLSSSESPVNVAITFGNNSKSQLAAKTVFNLALRHGDILREGWRNILDCILQLYKGKLLPKQMVEAEDFVHPRGTISLIKEEIPAQRAESGLFSSFYSYITLTSESQNQKGLSLEDESAVKAAEACISDCHPEHLITESKFLRSDSLQELVKAIIFASHGPDTHASSCGGYDEESTVFFLELLIKIVIQNRDRVGGFWTNVRDHIYSLVMGASASDHFFLMERAVVGILRLAIRLLRKEEMAPQVLQSLRMLLLLKSHILLRVSRQVSFALHELLRTNAANIHNSQDWSTLFTLLECVGAGCKPPKVVNSSSNSENESSLPASNANNDVQSDSELNSSPRISEYNLSRGYTSDSELYHADHGNNSSPSRHSLTNVNMKQSNISSGGGWIMVGEKGEIETVKMRTSAFNQYNITLNCDLMPHDTRAFMKSCESLAFLIRDVAHITPENFELCVRCIQTFVEASMNGGRANTDRRNSFKFKDRKISRRRKYEGNEVRRSPSSPQISYVADDEGDDEEEPPGGYHQISIQLLDLMHTLHTRAASIFSSWAAEESTSDSLIDATTNSLWAKCWCPLLQGISKLCCDARRQVRTSAVTYLQRALLVHDLQTLSAVEWEACFNKVLFPLLAKLLERLNPQDPIGMEETRVRGATLLSKVFLQHLTPLLTLPTFTALWLTILDFMDKYMHAENSELLYEAIPESLKNMLLVMDTAGVFLHQEPGKPSPLWTITSDRIETFLPGLSLEVFKPQQSRSPESSPVNTDESFKIPEKPDLNVTSSSDTVERMPDGNVCDVLSENEEAERSQKVSESHVIIMPETGDVASEDNASIITEEPSPGDLSKRSVSPLMMESAHFGQASAGSHMSVVLHSPLPNIVSNSPVQLHHSNVSPSVPIILNPEAVSQSNINEKNVDLAIATETSS